jgi:hypothetical protein
MLILVIDEFRVAVLECESQPHCRFERVIRRPCGETTVSSDQCGVWRHARQGEGGGFRLVTPVAGSVMRAADVQRAGQADRDDDLSRPTTVARRLLLKAGDVAMWQLARVAMPIRDLDRLRRIRSVRADIWFRRQSHLLEQPAGLLR